jgi:uncharacterized protein YodC (DUF2158 family)
MKLLRIVITYNAKKDTDVARQTTFIRVSDLELKNKMPIEIRGKHKVKELTIELVDSDELSKLISKEDVAMNAGDVVMLKSGGPKMTIGSIENSQCLCIWFVCDAVQKDVFPEIALKRTRQAEDAPKKKRSKKRTEKV